MRNIAACERGAGLADVNTRDSTILVPYEDLFQPPIPPQSDAPDLTQRFSRVDLSSSGFTATPSRSQRFESLTGLPRRASCFRQMAAPGASGEWRHVISRDRTEVSDDPFDAPSGIEELALSPVPLMVPLFRPPRTEVLDLIFGAEEEVSERKAEVADMPPLSFPPELARAFGPFAHRFDEREDPRLRLMVEVPGCQGCIAHVVERTGNDPVASWRLVHVPDGFTPSFRALNFVKATP